MRKNNKLETTYIWEKRKFNALMYFATNKSTLVSLLRFSIS